MVVVLLGVDAAYVALRLSSSLQEFRANVEQGVASLQLGRVAAGDASFSRAFLAATSATALVARPSVEVASYLPFIGRDATALKGLARAADLSSRAALEVSDAVHAAATPGGDLASSLYRDGRVRFDAFARAKPNVVDASALLGEAARALEVPEPILAPVGLALDDAGTRLAAARRSAQRAALFLDAMPDLLGARGTSRYFLAFQTPSEARATGGLIGLYGVLTATDGRIGLDQVGGIAELTTKLTHPVEAPTKWFARAYGPDSALRQFQQANLSPNFPVVSRVLLEMYEQATGEVLDGVIAMDPVALGFLTSATGPLQAKGLADAVGPDNAAEVLVHDTYVRFDDADAQTRYLERIIRQFWARVREGVFDAVTMAGALSEGAATQHLKMFSTNDPSQEALSGLDASGDFSLQGPNVQLVFHNNFGLNKIDYFLRRRIDTTIKLTRNGDAAVRTEVLLLNGAPSSGPPGLVGGGSKGYPAGLNQMSLHVLLPATADVETFRVDGKAIDPITVRDGGFPVAWYPVEIPPRDRARISVAYRIGDALTVTGEGGRFRFTMFPQAVARPDRFSVAIVPPADYVLVEGGQDGAYRTAGTLSEPITTDVELVRD